LRELVVEGNEEGIDILDRLGAGNDPIAEDMVEVSPEVGGEIVVE